VYAERANTYIISEVFTMKNKLHIGQTVRNFGVIAKVVGFHDITGDPILRGIWNDGRSWLASEAYCEAVSREEERLMRHKDGLICLG
jgi:hypothetical protein